VRRRGETLVETKPVPLENEYIKMDLEAWASRTTTELGESVAGGRSSTRDPRCGTRFGSWTASSGKRAGPAERTLLTSRKLKAVEKSWAGAEKTNARRQHGPDWRKWSVFRKPNPDEDTGADERNLTNKNDLGGGRCWEKWSLSGKTNPAAGIEQTRGDRRRLLTGNESDSPPLHQKQDIAQEEEEGSELGVIQTRKPKSGWGFTMGAENKIESLSRKMNGANKTAKQFFFIAIKHDI
jgi:hypothetical protein